METAEHQPDPNAHLTYRGALNTAPSASPRVHLSIAVPAQREAQSQQITDFAKRVQAVPDSLFADDTEVQRLTREVEQREQRAQRMTRGMSEEARRQLLDGLHQQIARAEKDLLLSALDDATEGDQGFRRTIIQARHVEHLQRVRAAAESAIAILSKSLPERMAPFNEDVTQARTALRSYLTERKREHVRQASEEA